MKPAAFDYLRPHSVETALAALADHDGDARIIAGGQSLTAMLNMRLATPTLLVDIARIAALKNIARHGEMIEVGAGVTQSELLAWPQLADAQPLLAQMLPSVGHYQTRQRGTVCGSLAHADPAAELPLALAVLDGAVVVQNRRGKRTIPAADFQTGMMTTALEAGEMIVACRFPTAAPGTATAFREVSQRHGDFALAACAAVGRADGVRLGVGGVAQTPTIIDLAWLDAAGMTDALNEFAWDLDAADDHHATARYRRELVRRIGQQVISEVSHVSS